MPIITITINFLTRMKTILFTFCGFLLYNVQAGANVNVNRLWTAPSERELGSDGHCDAAENHARVVAGVLDRVNDHTLARLGNRDNFL